MAHNSHGPSATKMQYSLWGGGVGVVPAVIGSACTHVMAREQVRVISGNKCKLSGVHAVCMHAGVCVCVLQNLCCVKCVKGIINVGLEFYSRIKGRLHILMIDR